MRGVRRPGRRARVGGGGSPPPPTTGPGPGPNAPAWSGKLYYPEELFTTPIPTTSLSASGFRGYQGFDGAVTWLPQRVTYPTIATPIGTKPVLQVRYPGASTTLTAVGQVTDPYPVQEDPAETTYYSARLLGGWTGEVVFESSEDGGTSWQSQNFRYLRDVNNTTVTGGGDWPSATVGGTYAMRGGMMPTPRLVRVRCTALTSGSIPITYGFGGGAAPARGNIGNFPEEPTRVYYRILYRNSAGWVNNGNSGTKFFFFSQISEGGQATNHFVNLDDSTYGYRPTVTMQNTSSYITRATTTYTPGEWLDLELIMIANTAGVANGVAQMWINGAQVMNQADVPYYPATHTPRFRGMWLDPTYGGGTNPPPQDQFLQIAYVYREAAL